MLRAIAFLVRDENWGTFTPKIIKLRSSSTSGFKVAYDAICGDAKRELAYRAEISCARRLSGSSAAQPKTDFETNRTGFVVLHPLKGVAGKPVNIEHVDEAKDKDKFPAVINPVQPFSMSTMTHSPDARCNGEVASKAIHSRLKITAIGRTRPSRPMYGPWLCRGPMCCPRAKHSHSREAQFVRKITKAQGKVVWEAGLGHA